MKPFRNLQSKLTLSYFLFSLAIVVVLVPAAITSTFYEVHRQFESKTVSHEAAAEVGQYLPSLSIILSSKPINAELMQSTLDRIWKFRQEDSPSNRSTLIAVTDPRGRILAAAPKGKVTLGNPLSEYIRREGQIVLSKGLNGEIDPSKTLTLSPNGQLIYVAPVLTHDRILLGTLYIENETPSAFKEIATLLFADLFFTALIIIVVGAGCGVGFGFFVSRALTKRVTLTWDAARHWSRGDFQISAPESPPDELGELGKNLNQMAREMKTMMESRQQLAASEERDRLSRDLHDTVKQHAFAVAIQIEAARRAVESGNPNSVEILAAAERIAQETPRLLSGIVHQLREAEDPNKTVNLVGFVISSTQALCEVHGLNLQLVGEPDVEVLLGEAQTVKLILSEALANVVQHSRANKVTLNIRRLEDGKCQVIVEDNGRGFTTDSAPRPTPQGGLGWVIMRERARVLPLGQLSVTSQIESGTKVSLMFLPTVREASDKP